VALTEPLAIVDAALSEHFGQVPSRASVSYVGVDQIEVLRFEPIPGERIYVSLGMARHPMTSAGESVVTADGPRAELMLHLSDPTDQFAEVWRRLALLAAAPAVEGVVYADGMTVDIGEPLLRGSNCTGAVVTQSPLAAVTTEVGDIEVLQLTPATQNELAWSRVHGSAALRQRWADAQTELLDLGRRSVSLA
jgi:hypothetical protein